MTPASRGNDQTLDPSRGGRDFQAVSRRGRRVGWRQRWLLAAWGLLLLSGFGVARMLVPHPNGFGTHQQLGLPPCTVQYFLQLPCPSCGMTTSFAHFTRGALVQSVRANAGGALLAVLCAGQVVWCLTTALRGRYWLLSEPLTFLMWCLLAVVTVSLVNWGVRLAGLL